MDGDWLILLLQAVEDNLTTMKSYPDSGLGVDPHRCHRVKSYAEALGLMAAHKAGVNLASLTPHIPSIPLHGTGEGGEMASPAALQIPSRAFKPQTIGL